MVCSAPIASLPIAAVCEEGAVNITASTGTANAFCYGGVWYDVVLRTQSAPGGGGDSRGRGRDAGAVLGSLLGVSVLALTAVSIFFILWVLKNRKKETYSLTGTA